MTETANKTAAPQIVDFTEIAIQEIRKLYDSQPESGEKPQGLRVGVKGGGCSGMSYKLAFDEHKDNDYVLDINGVPVYIDPKSAIYVKGMVVDYQGGLEGKGFVFQNPNATSTCGCGESFSV